MQFQPCKSKLSSESGVYLIWFLLIIVALIGVCGLAIDTARLYQAKKELQNIADATTLAAARMLIERQDLDYNQVEAKTRDLIRENLILTGLDRGLNLSDQTWWSLHTKICFDQQGDCSTGQPPATDAANFRRHASVELKLELPTLLVSILPGVSKFSTLNAWASAKNLGLEVVMVLDVSRSMEDDAGSGDAPSGSCPDVRKWSKLCWLKYASKAFVDALLPSDKIGLTDFSTFITSPATNPTYQPYESPYCSQHDCWSTDRRVIDTISNWQLVWQTFQQHDSKIVSDITALSDAAAKNFIKSGIDSLQIIRSTDLASGIYKGRSLLNSTPVVANTQKVLVVLTDGMPYAHDSTCRVSQNGSPLYYLNCLKDDGSGQFENIAQCENGESAQILGPFPASVLTSSGGTDHLSDTEEQIRRERYLNAIVESDKARDLGQVVYSIGFGGQDNNSQNQFQSAFTDSRKDFLLGRVANDQVFMRNPSPTLPTGLIGANQDYPSDFPCTRKGAALLNRPQGTYFRADKGTDLVQAFFEIANQRTLLTR